MDEGLRAVIEPEPEAKHQQKSPPSQLHAYIASHPELRSSSSSRTHQPVPQSSRSRSKRKEKEIEQDYESEHEPSSPSRHHFEKELSHSASRRHYRTAYSPSRASPPSSALPSTASSHRYPTSPRSLEPKYQHRPIPPTPRRSSIDPLPSTHDEFAMHLKGLEVRAEVELDLDEGVSAVGWEESTVEGDEEEIMYEDGVDRSGHRDRSGTARPDSSRGENLYTHSQSRESLYQAASRSHSSPLSRRLPTSSPSPPALPDLPSHSISGSEEEQEIDTYSSRRARMFSGERKGKMPMVGGGSDASASASASRSRSYSRSLSVRLNEDEDKEATKEYQMEDEAVKYNAPGEKFLEEVWEGGGVTIEREQSNYHSSDRSSRTPLPTNHRHTPSPVRLPVRHSRARTPPTTFQTGTTPSSTTTSPGQRQPQTLLSSRALSQSQSPTQIPKFPTPLPSSQSNANPVQKQLATPSHSHSQTLALGPTPRPPGAWNITPFPQRPQREPEPPRHQDQIASESGRKTGRVRFSPLRYEATIHREDYEREDEMEKKGKREEEGGDVSILTLSLSPRHKNPKSPKSPKNSKSRTSPERQIREGKMDGDIGDISWTAKLARSVTS